MLNLYVFPPVVIPALNCDVALISLTIQLSEVPKSASAPVSGWMKATAMSLVVPVLLVEPPLLLPLILELHASSSPPPPTTAALAPAARSRPRRLRGVLLARGDEPESPPRPPRFWGDPSPQTPLEAPPAVLSGCAVWSLICNRSPLGR